MATYNGWKNRETWNVALWLGNDEGLYILAKEYVEHWRSKGRKAHYQCFIKATGLIDDRTPDGIKYNGRRVSRRELSAMLNEL